MLAIYRKELKLYFCSFFSYLAIGLILLMFGLLSSAFNLYMGYASLAFPLGYMGIAAIFSAPLLTIAQCLRDRRKDAEKLLLSLPVSPVSIVLGRFFAVLTVLTIPTLVMSLVPLLFAAFGGNAIPVSEMSVLGYFFLTALFLAISQFVTFFFQNVTVACVVSVAIPALVYVTHSVLSLFYFEGIVEKFICIIDPIHHYFAFTYGNLDLSSLFYLLSLCFLFLFLSVIHLKKKRGDFYAPKNHFGFRSLSATVAVVILALNIGTFFIPEKIDKIDISGLNIFRITGKTTDVVQALEEDVSIYYLCKGGEKKADSDLYTFLKKYTWESQKIKVEVVDTEKNPDFIKAYTEVTPSDQSMLVVGEKRHYLVDYNDLYYYYYENGSMGIQIPPDYYSLLLQSYLTYIQTGSMSGLDSQTMSIAQQLFYSTTTSAFFNGESAITNAIRYVTCDEVSNIYVLMDDSFSIREEYLNYFEPSLLQNGYWVKYLTSLDTIPQDCDILFVFPLEKDLKSEEAETLKAYLADDGKMFLMTETHPEFTNFYSVLSEYGLNEQKYENLLCEETASNIISEQLNIFIATVKETPVTDGAFEGSFVALTPHSIVLEEKEGVTLTPWITTTQKGYLITKETEEDDERVYDMYTLGALAEKGNTRIGWITSPMSVSYTMGENFSSGGNYSLLLSAFDWLHNSPYSTVTISATKMVNSAISIEDKDLPVWIFLFVFPLPVATLAIGGIRAYVRKKK